MYKECLGCMIAQVKKITGILHLSKETEEYLIRETNLIVQQCPSEITSPECMDYLWNLIEQKTGVRDPFESAKVFFNDFVMNLLDDIKAFVQDDLKLVLKVAIAANLIDFSANINIEKEEVEKALFKAKDMKLSKDDSESLWYDLKTKKSLLYIGDNCGEIVVDKLFIEMIKKNYPHLDVYYGYRGKAIANDVTIKDIKQVKMEEICKCISNGNGAQGTVLSLVSDEFRKVFDNSDVIICKGQGNYEGLIDVKKESLYFLFMVKCNLVASLAGAKLFDIVCKKQIFSE